RSSSAATSGESGLSSALPWAWVRSDGGLVDAVLLLLLLLLISNKLATSSGRDGCSGSLTRRAHQPFGGGARFGGNLSAREHAGDLFAPTFGRKLAHARRHPLTFVERILGDQIVMLGAGGDLRRVSDGQGLHALAEACQPQADGIRNRAADPGIDFVKHQGRGGAAAGEHDLERQQKAREFTAGGNLHQWARTGAGIGLHP